MKRLILTTSAALLLLVTAGLSSQISESTEQPAEEEKFQATLGERNPWTHLRFNDENDDFQFVIVTDRTGGHRPKIFSRAVEQINLLQPEFVLSVGDLIEGYTNDMDRVEKEWAEFQGFVSNLQMPFFYVAGNHDITNLPMLKLWGNKFGRRYYHFTYKDVLFLCLLTEDPPGSGAGQLSDEQVAWVEKVLKKNPEPRWTVVAMHKPIWAYGDLNKNGWLKVENLLAGRPYTVFAGHVHRYQKYIRNGMNYYALATTGGGSRLRGLDYGEFDHIVWVTMKDDGPQLANLMLDGILPQNLRMPESDEGGTIRSGTTFSVRGKAYLRGTPANGAVISFYQIDPKNPQRLRRTSDALVEPDGRFTLSTFGKFDGAPEGEYVVTMIPWRGYPGDPAEIVPLEIPEKYRNAKTSPLRATVKSGTNEFEFNLN